MNAPLAGETSKAYYTRQERHWTALAAAALGPDSDTDDEMSEKEKERLDKKRMLILKKKAKELSELAFAEASAIPS